MNPFKSDAAPYMLVLLVSVLGWYLSHMASEIENTQAVSYRIMQGDASEAVVRIKNVSRVKTLNRVQFSIICKDRGSCFKPGTQPDQFGAVRIFSPTSPTATSLTRNTAEEVSVTTTLPGGAMIDLSARLVTPGSAVEFFYIPAYVTGDKPPLDIYIVDGSGLQGWFLENYFNLLIISFLALFGVFVIWLLASLIGSFRKGYHETISVDRGGDAGGGGDRASAAAGGATARDQQADGPRRIG